MLVLNLALVALAFAQVEEKSCGNDSAQALSSQRRMTEDELEAYDASDPKLPILLAYDGVV